MFRAMISSIFRSTRLCVTACGIMHQRCCCRPIAWKLRFQAIGRQHRRCIIPQAVTQSSAPEDGGDHRPKHVELILIINKLLLLHLVGCLYYLSCLSVCLSVCISVFSISPAVLIFFGGGGNLSSCGRIFVKYYVGDSS